MRPDLLKQCLALPGNRGDAISHGDRNGPPSVGCGSNYFASSPEDVWGLKAFFAAASPQERGLVTGILENDADPARRLVYADFLEENGRTLEAEAERAAAEQLMNRPANVQRHALLSGAIDSPYSRVVSGSVVSGLVQFYDRPSWWPDHMSSDISG